MFRANCLDFFEPLIFRLMSRIYRALCLKIVSKEPLYHFFILFFLRKMSRKIFIGNLPDRADGRDVEDFFRGCGRIVEISLKDGYGNLENLKPFVNLNF